MSLTQSPLKLKWKPTCLTGESHTKIHWNPHWKPTCLTEKSHTQDPFDLPSEIHSQRIQKKTQITHRIPLKIEPITQTKQTSITESHGRKVVISALNCIRPLAQNRRTPRLILNPSSLTKLGPRRQRRRWWRWVSLQLSFSPTGLSLSLSLSLSLYIQSSLPLQQTP